MAAGAADGADAGVGARRRGISQLAHVRLPVSPKLCVEGEGEFRKIGAFLEVDGNKVTKWGY